MAITLQVIEGPNEGSKFKAQEGLKIGRGKGEIRLDDPKISGIHAKIELDAKGQLILSDLKSANGIFLSGRRVLKVALLPGVIFHLGDTALRVDEALDFAEEPSKKIITWRERLLETLRSLDLQNHPQKMSIILFKKPVILTFLQGIQADQSVTLLYGPQTAGSNSLNIELLDLEAPQKAFTISTTKNNDIIFLNRALGKVRVNDKNVSEAILKNNDLIHFGMTVIRVTFL